MWPWPARLPALSLITGLLLVVVIIAQPLDVEVCLRLLCLLLLFFFFFHAVELHGTAIEGSWYAQARTQAGSGPKGTWDHDDASGLQQEGSHDLTETARPALLPTAGVCAVVAAVADGPVVLGEGLPRVDRALAAPPTCHHSQHPTHGLINRASASL